MNISMRISMYTWRCTMMIHVSPLGPVTQDFLVLKRLNWFVWNKGVAPKPHRSQPVWAIAFFESASEEEFDIRPVAASTFSRIANNRLVPCHVLIADVVKRQDTHTAHDISWLVSSLIVDEIFAPSCKLSLTPSDLLRRVKVAKGWSHHGPNGYRSGPQYEHAGLQCTLYSGKSHDTGHVRTLKRKSSSPIPGHAASCLAHDMGLWVGHLVLTSACFERHLIPQIPMT